MLANRGSRAPFAFKDLMIHSLLQFALRIAFRCVLHRRESQDIRCWGLLNFLFFCSLVWLIWIRFVELKDGFLEKEGRRMTSRDTQTEIVRDEQRYAKRYEHHLVPARAALLACGGGERPVRFGTGKVTRTAEHDHLAAKIPLGERLRNARDHHPPPPNNKQDKTREVASLPPSTGRSLRSQAALASLAPLQFNDPSAGSPTETLLRLLLPLDDQIRVT